MTTESNLKTFKFYSCLTEENTFEHRIFIGTNYENSTPIIEKLMLFGIDRGSKELIIPHDLIKVISDKDYKAQTLFQKFDTNYQPRFIIELEGELKSLNVYEVVKVDIFSRNIDCHFKFKVSKEEIKKYSLYNSNINSKEKEIILDALYAFLK